jgi:hypothetical protein
MDGNQCRINKLSIQNGVDKGTYRLYTREFAYRETSF